MIDTTPESILSATVAEGIKELSALSEEEYDANLQELMEDPNSTDEQRLLRIGRLMGVVLKQPFSECQKIDPTDPAQTRTGARRGWEVRPEFLRYTDMEFLDKCPTESSTWQYDILNRLRGEEGYSSVPNLMEELQYEGRFFSALARSFRKHVCGDANLRRQLNEAIVKAERRGGSGPQLTPEEALLSAGGIATIAVFLVQAFPLLVVAPPLLGGFALIVHKYGINSFCLWTDQWRHEQVEE